jgi:HlyD family secretion protein
MSTKKIIILVVIVLVVAGIAAGTILYSQAGITKVATGKVLRQDLVATVSGTGQIKPKTYVNVGATSFGRITHLYVKEGDHVKKGDILARVEACSPRPPSTPSRHHRLLQDRHRLLHRRRKHRQANIAEAKADLEQKKFDFDRAQALYNGQLIAKQDFDAKKAAYDVSAATVAQRVAALAQAKAQTASQRAHLDQAMASQRANFDALDKTISRAPFDGLVTNVPVREGETVVVGIQNAEGSTLMTLADMSVITAEVKVDETDIVNMSLGQPADVTVDALPGRTFKGHVTEVGDQALLRTTGIATSQSTTGTEEAKDFKVVVTLDQLPAKTSTRSAPASPPPPRSPSRRSPASSPSPSRPWCSAIPQSKSSRRPMAAKPSTDYVSAATASPKPNPPAGRLHPHHLQRQAPRTFVPVTTGVTGATDIEVLSGLKQGDEIVTGRYQILRALKSGTQVKRDNTHTTDTSTTPSSSIIHPIHALLIRTSEPTSASSHQYF